MKSFSTVVACLGLICAAPSTLAQVQVNVAAGDLADAVDSLSRQTGVNVLSPGDLLKGHTTAGFAGTLSPPEAFSRLLEGTSLTATHEFGAVRIAQASLPRPVAAAAEVVKASEQVREKSTCRNVSSLTGVVQSMCGTAAQWAEFDSRIVKLDKGFSCKPVPGSRPLCLFAKQWKYVERKNLLYSGTKNNNTFGDGARESAMAIHRSDANMIMQSLIDANNGRPVITR